MKLSEILPKIDDIDGIPTKTIYRVVFNDPPKWSTISQLSDLNISSFLFILLYHSPLHYALILSTHWDHPFVVRCPSDVCDFWTVPFAFYCIGTSLDTRVVVNQNLSYIVPNCQKSKLLVVLFVILSMDVLVRSMDRVDFYPVIVFGPDPLDWPSERRGPIIPHLIPQHVGSIH